MSKQRHKAFTERIKLTGESKKTKCCEYAACEGKDAFDTPQMAARIARKSKYPAKHYRCKACGKYHIAGKPKK